MVPSREKREGGSRKEKEDDARAARGSAAPAPAPAPVPPQPRPGVLPAPTILLREGKQPPSRPPPPQSVPSTDVATSSDGLVNPSAQSRRGSGKRGRGRGRGGETEGVHPHRHRQAARIREASMFFSLVFVNDEVWPKIRHSRAESRGLTLKTFLIHRNMSSDHLLKVSSVPIAFYFCQDTQRSSRFGTVICYSTVERLTLGAAALPRAISPVESRLRSCCESQTLLWTTIIRSARGLLY